MELPERIEINAEIAFGKPVVRGTRIPVVLVVEMVAGGVLEEEILDNYPDLSSEDISACLQYFLAFRS